MKNTMLMTLVGMMLPVAILFGDTLGEYVNGYYWSYYIEDNSAIICNRYEQGFNGQDWTYSYSPAIQPSPVGTVAIPLTLGGYPVTGIGNEAFRDCYEITNVVIHDGIKDIGDFAFSGCLGLESVVIGKDVERIGKYAFNGIRDSGEVPANLASLIICATNLQKLGSNAFPALSGSRVDCTYTFVAPETTLASLPDIRRGQTTFVGWWTALDGGEKLANAADAVPGQTYYAHWSDEQIQIARVELAIPENVTVRDDDWSMIGRYGTDFIAAVYDANGNVVDDWEYDCDMGIYYAWDPETPFSWYVYEAYPNEWGEYYGHEVSTLPAGNYIVKINGNGTYCTGEATAPLNVNMFYASYSWELDSDDWCLDVGGSTFYPSYYAGWEWEFSGHYSTTTTDCGFIGVYSPVANVNTAIVRLADIPYYMGFYAKISGERRLPGGSWEEVWGINYDGYTYYQDLAHMDIVTAGAYDITVDVFGHREYDEVGYSHIEEDAYGLGYFHFELAPASFTNQTITTQNGQGVFTGEAIRPLAQGFSLSLDDPTTYFIEDIVVTNVGTYAVRVGLSTDENWALSAPCADGEWVERIHSGDGCVSHPGDYLGDVGEDVIFNYTGVVEVAYTVLPRPVVSEQARVAPCELHCDGTPQTCELVITNDYTGMTLVGGVDYDVAYSNNILAGTATATVRCKGNYTGSFSLDFEILPSTNVVEVLGLEKAWATAGDAEWFAEWSENAHDGVSCMRSGAIGDGQESWIETVVTNTGVVSFWWKASSEAYRGIAYDKLIFTVDGEIPESVPPIGGEVDWTNVTLVVEGDGPHVLRWTYRKDASDSDGEDCAWLDDVQYLREVHVVFADGGATAGAAPDAITVGEGAEITLPDQSSLEWPKHRFIGWRTGDDVLAAGTAYALGYDDVAFTAEWEEKRVVAPSIEVAAWYDTERTTVSMSCETAGAMIRYTLDGSTPTAASPIYAGAFNLAGSATIRAVAVLDDWFDSEIVSAVSVRAPWTPDECLNATGMVFRTGGDAEWRRDRTVAHDGDTAMRSGAIGDGQESWIETTVDGAGTLTFWWKASSEAYKGTLYDRARFTVDGVAPIPDIGGEADWRSESVMIAGNGSHVLRWTYAKDDLNTSGEDCAWLDEVTWTPNVTEEFVVDGVSVPASFLNEKYPALLEAANGDHMMALEATAANGVNKVWECYVAGLVPTNATDIFRSVISFENGAPVISWEPDLNEGGTKQERVYTVEGRESLTEGDWEELTIESGELKVDGYRFFRVKVALPSR